MADHASRVVPNPELAVRLTDALMSVSVLSDLGNRRLCVQVAMEQLQIRVSVPEFTEKKLHLISMVRAFGAVDRGWQCLTDAVQYLADYDLPSVHAASLANPVALPVLPDSSELELRNLLAGLDRTTVPELADVYLAVAGAHFGPLPDGATTAWEAHQLLAQTNLPTDGVPRSMRLLQELAVVLSQERGDALRAWAVRRLRTTSDDPVAAQRALESPRPDVGRRPDGDTRSAYVMIRLNPSISSPDRVDVTCWINVGSRWAPRRRDERSVPHGQVRRYVATLVDREEARLHNHRGGVVLEFVLPVSMLNEPVEQWTRIGLLGGQPLWESEHGGPPFWQDYTVVVRSLERLEALQLHRVWNERWDVLTARGGDARAHRCDGYVTAESRRLYLRLKENPSVVLMALGAPPDEEQGMRELLTGLHAGLPLLVWSHSGTLTEQAHRAAESALAAPLDELLDRMVRLRAVPAAKDDEDVDTGTGIAVLWDDPNRLPDFPEPVLSGTTETLADSGYDL